MQKIGTIINLSEEEKDSLKVNYSKEKKENEGFEEFVFKHKIKDSVGLRYTSALKEAKMESENCKNCGGIQACKNKVEGFCYTPVVKENNIDFSYVSCKYENRILEDTKYQKYVTLFDIPKEIKNASFKDIHLDDKNRVPVIKYMKEFLDQYEKNKEQKGLYLSGNFGSGKTYLLAALFNEEAKRKVNSILVYFPEFLRKIKSSFNDNNYEEKFELVKKVDLLLIDDIGAENLTQWGRDEVLGVILQYRMDEKLPTFFTSNLTLEELEKHLSITNGGIDKVKARRIIERIKQLTIPLELVGKNRRK